MGMNSGGLGRMLMEEVMIHFTALPQHLTSGTEEDHERLTQCNQHVPIKF
jgi:hypothetical protein